MSFSLDFLNNVYLAVGFNEFYRGIWPQAIFRVRAKTKMQLFVLHVTNGRKKR